MKFERLKRRLIRCQASLFVFNLLSLFGPLTSPDEYFAVIHIIGVSCSGNRNKEKKRPIMPEKKRVFI